MVKILSEERFRCLNNEPPGMYSRYSLGIGSKDESTKATICSLNNQQVTVERQVIVLTCRVFLMIRLSCSQSV